MQMLINYQIAIAIVWKEIIIMVLGNKINSARHYSKAILVILGFVFRF